MQHINIRTLKYLDSSYDSKDQPAISSILRDVATKADIRSAEQQLLIIPSFSRFIAPLRPAERDDFQRHMRRYLSVHLPECAFEISRTNRYNTPNFEASVVARIPILRGQDIKFLGGITVQLTEQQELDLIHRDRDFSIMQTTRMKRTLCMAGPARCSNHDCAANAAFVGTASPEIKTVATRDIKPKEEINVYYSGHYFEADNCLCLCESCATRLRNEAWTEDARNCLQTGRYPLRHRKQREAPQGGNSPKARDG